MKRMEAVQDKYDYKIMVTKEDWDRRNFAKYRLIPTESYENNTSLFAYGDKLAFMDFNSPEDMHILVLRQHEFLDSFKALFKLAWVCLKV